jgi:hypothetical protein
LKASRNKIILFDHFLFAQFKPAMSKAIMGISLGNKYLPCGPDT